MHACTSILKSTCETRAGSTFSQLSPPDAAVYATSGAHLSIALSSFKAIRFSPPTEACPDVAARCLSPSAVRVDTSASATLDRTTFQSVASGCSAVAGSGARVYSESSNLVCRRSGPAAGGEASTVTQQAPSPLEDAPQPIEDPSQAGFRSRADPWFIELAAQHGRSLVQSVEGGGAPPPPDSQVLVLLSDTIVAALAVSFMVGNLSHRFKRVAGCIPSVLVVAFKARVTEVDRQVPAVSSS